MWRINLLHPAATRQSVDGVDHSVNQNSHVARGEHLREQAAEFGNGPLRITENRLRIAGNPGFGPIKRRAWFVQIHEKSTSLRLMLAFSCQTAVPLNGPAIMESMNMVNVTRSTAPHTLTSGDVARIVRNVSRPHSSTRWRVAADQPSERPPSVFDGGRAAIHRPTTRAKVTARAAPTAGPSIDDTGDAADGIQTRRTERGTRVDSARARQRAASSRRLYRLASHVPFRASPARGGRGERSNTSGAAQRSRQSAKHWRRRGP